MNIDKNERLPHILSAIIRSEFYPLDYYFEELENSVQEKKQDFYKFLDKRTKDLKTDQVEEIIDIYYDDLALKRDEFPRLLKYSFVILLYSRIETALRSICIAHMHFNNTYNQFNHMKKNGPHEWNIWKCLNYLKKNTVSKNIKRTNFGKMITLLNKIRNNIVHNNGYIRKDVELRKRINSHKELKIIDNRLIDVDFNYIIRRLKLSEHFLSELAIKIYD